MADNLTTDCHACQDSLNMQHSKYNPKKIYRLFYVSIFANGYCSRVGGKG